MTFICTKNNEKMTFMCSSSLKNSSQRIGSSRQILDLVLFFVEQPVFFVEQPVFFVEQVVFFVEQIVFFVERVFRRKCSTKNTFDEKNLTPFGL